MELFINGIWDEALTYESDLPISEVNVLQIGKGDEERQCDSAIAFISVYNEFLSDGEILSRYNSRKELHFSPDCFSLE